MEVVGTVLIPVGPGDQAWTRLAEDLACLPASWEILLVGTEQAPAAFAVWTRPGGVQRWIEAAPGRAQQLNAGAREARGQHLWILHSDSRMSRKTFLALQRSLSLASDALHYFDLRFLADGPRLMALNTAGAWLRSHLLGLPFGDQGFCLKKDRLLALGGFDERAAYGEDHLLVWAAKRAGLPLRCTGATLATSARKYASKGWLRTTALHLKLTADQVRQEWSR